ncbi:MAG: AAA family ATPase [Candidatus Omnitrophica bacterium]|nr:AAA family ATPase [Candidatus Omnitrophota bacterium]
MKIISVVNQKGGCGKTTLAVNLAAALSRVGKETLIIDLDPQAHATFSLGYWKKSSERKTAYDIFRSHIDGGQTPFAELVIADRQKMSFVPANMLLSSAEINLGGVDGAAAILFHALADPFFAKYDYVIIDSPPSFGFLTLNSMYAADMLLVPIDLSYFSFNSVNSVYRVAGLLNRETGRSPDIFFMMNIYDQRSNFAKILEREAREKLGQYLLSSRVRSSVRLREAAKLGKTIFEHDPKCSASLDFYNLTSEILGLDESELDTAVREFVLHAPKAGSVHVLGDFNGWKKGEASRLAQFENGDWSIHFNLKKGRHRYKYFIDGKWMPDPANPRTEANIFGSQDSILTV